MNVNGEGPIPARILLVGEAPSEREEELGLPFQGPAGQELNRMLGEAGIMRSECYLTNIARVRPPNNYIGNFIALKKKDITASHIQLRDRWVTHEVVEGYAALLAEIEMVKPNIIVAFGNLALWALTGAWGVLKWRGSQLTSDSGIKVIPTLSPTAVFREWSTRALVVTDFRRVKRYMGTSGVWEKPNWNFIIRPSFSSVILTLDNLRQSLNAAPLWIDLDIETKVKHIECIGLSWSLTEAIIIPLMCVASPAGYWSEEEEAAIVYQLYKVLTHPNVRIRWQNGLYDAQYIFRHWHFIPRHGQDTMISHHSAFCALPKGLGFLASMYANYYAYWKDEGKEATSSKNDDQRWTYNAQDCVYTREVGETLTQTLKTLGLEQVDATQQSLFYPVLHAMIRGVHVIKPAKERMAMEIQEELSKREAFLYSALGHVVNIDSPKQMLALFYEDLKQRPVLNRVIIDGRMTMRPTCDDEALQAIAAREPLLKPITNAIADIRTLGKFLNEFVMMQLDEDGRMRCSYNIAGDAGGKSAPYSYRLSSSKNAFGSGGNLQTIPSEKSKSSGKAAARGSMDFTLPNIRSMFGPDSGFTFFDMDLDRADLQIVVWESGEPEWKAAMRLGVDMHLLNVYALDGKEPPPYEELVETHPRYPDHKGPRKHKREFAKVFCHATNYKGGAKTVAAHTGRSVHEVDQAQKKWFSMHPGILRWHQNTWEQILKRRFVENRFGYKWHIFDRIDENMLPEALAWIPQSTVGIYINKIWIAFYQNLPEVQVLLQVHDSLAGQFPTHRASTLLPLMKEYSRIIVPYEDPLIIPVGIKTSIDSWGACA